MRRSPLRPKAFSLTGRNQGAGAGRPPLVREVLFLTAAFLLYKLGRRLANGQFETAYDNAARVWDLERALRLPSEAGVQELLLRSEPLIQAINTYYATVHFPAMVLFMVWMYWRHPAHYGWIRWVLIWLSASALLLHLSVPLAPPRLFEAAGMTDTSAVYGPSVYGDPEPDSMANQFAAMPSLHVGWAVVIALGLIVASGSRWRWLWLVHPFVTVIAVVATAHHYWLDGIVAGLLLASVVALVRPPRRTAPVPITVRPGPPLTSAPPSVTPAAQAPAAPGEAGQDHPAG